MKKIIVRKSGIHGRGVFAAVSIKKGELIDFVRGPIIRRVEKTKKAALEYPDLIGISGITRTTWIDPLPPFKYLNHSCLPNAGIKGKVSVRALKNIGSGEEICIDYSTVVGNPLWEMRCLCHAKKCRVKIGSIQSLPRKEYNKYLPYIPKYFQILYKRYN